MKTIVVFLAVAAAAQAADPSVRRDLAYARAGVSARACPAEGKNHTTINADLGLPGDRPTEEPFAFLRTVLKDR